jgi:S1-C subfamily serine protease
MELADQTPAVGSEVCVIGHAFGYKQLSIQFGRVALALDDDGSQMRVGIDMVPGDSGGPLMDTQGRLVGIASAIYYIGPAHLSGLVRVEDIRDFAEPYLPKK